MESEVDHFPLGDIEIVHNASLVHNWRHFHKGPVVVQVRSVQLAEVDHFREAYPAQLQA
jgi:hypothetical protein